MTAVTELSWSGFNTRDIVSGHSPAVLLKEETIPAAAVTSLTAVMSSEAIHLIAGTGPDFVVQQIGRQDTPQGGIFTASVQDGRLSIARDSGYRGTVGIFVFSTGPHRLVIEVPPSFTGDVSLQTSSGGIRLESAFTLGQVDLRTSSGGVRLYHDLTADSAALSSTSGSVRSEGRLSITSHLSIRSTSGGIRLNGRADAGTFDLSTSSGGIRAGGGLSGSGRLKSASGGITATLALPLGNVDAETSSGGVTLTVPRGHEFNFLGDTSSGSIRADFELHARGNRPRNSVAGLVGSNPQTTITARATSGGIRIQFNN